MMRSGSSTTPLFSCSHPASISYDLDFATEVDDEYWIDTDNQLSFKQPAGKPSIISFFNAFLKLHQIVAFALRTIVSHLSLAFHVQWLIPFQSQYSINKSKVLLGYVGPQWQQNIVAQLDSALNKWIENIPDHRKSNFFCVFAYTDRIHSPVGS